MDEKQLLRLNELMRLSEEMGLGRITAEERRELMKLLTKANSTGLLGA
jgi:hypothetical protein